MVGAFAYFQGNGGARDLLGGELPRGPPDGGLRGGRAGVDKCVWA